MGDPGPELMFDDRVYKRGALALHALRLRCGDLAFFSLLHEWAGQNRHGSVSTQQFILTADRATGPRYRVPAAPVAVPGGPAADADGRLAAVLTAAGFQPAAAPRPVDDGQRGGKAGGQAQGNRVQVDDDGPVEQAPRRPQPSAGSIRSPVPRAFSKASLRAQSRLPVSASVLLRRPGKSCCRSAEVRATSSNPGNITSGAVLQVHARRRRAHAPAAGAAGREQDPAGAAGKAQAEATGGAVQPVAGRGRGEAPVPCRTGDDVVRR